MAWSPKTKPTPANIRKRLDAAIGALNAALALAEGHACGRSKVMVGAVRNARDWTIIAHQRVAPPRRRPA